MNDTAWVRKILKGDQAAGERLVTEHYPRIYRWLRNLTGNVEIAQDLTQQTFTRAWQSLASYRGEARLVTWLHSIAYHEYTHWLRDKRDNARLEDVIDMADLRAMPGLNALLLQRALTELSSEARETFLLFYVQELAVQEVAVVLNVPAGTVKSRLFAARQRLRELLADEQPSPQATALPIMRSSA